MNGLRGVGMMLSSIIILSGCVAATAPSTRPATVQTPVRISTPTPRVTAVRPTPDPAPTGIRQAPTSAPQRVRTGPRWPRGSIQADRAWNRVGEQAVVCGYVADTSYQRSISGRPTFLNFERRYPDHVFTVVIWAEDRDGLPARPEVAFDDKNVCATGRISEYDGIPQIEHPTSLRIIE